MANKIDSYPKNPKFLDAALIDKSLRFYRFPKA